MKRFLKSFSYAKIRRKSFFCKKFQRHLSNINNNACYNRTKLAMLLVIKTPCITNCCPVMLSMPGLTVHSKNEVDNLNTHPVIKEEKLVVIISKALTNPHPTLSAIEKKPPNPNVSGF